MMQTQAQVVLVHIDILLLNKKGKNMIIFKKEKNYQTFSNADIEQLNINDNVYYVKDETNLANKIKEFAPYFNFVIDMDGELIDVTPIERTLEPQPPTTEERLISIENAITALMGV